jgi:hypothetical protein
VKLWASLLASFLVTTSAFSSEIKLEWAPRTAAVGYKIGMGTWSGVYNVQMYVGNTTSWEVHDLKAGVLYFFVVKYITTDGQESDWSDEIVVEVI